MYIYQDEGVAMSEEIADRDMWEAQEKRTKARIRWLWASSQEEADKAYQELMDARKVIADILLARTIYL
jgi:hypothetical protein